MMYLLCFSDQCFSESENAPKLTAVSRLTKHLCPPSVFIDDKSNVQIDMILIAFLKEIHG